jgi:ATP-dependent RNA helicase RhlE
LNRNGDLRGNMSFENWNLSKSLLRALDELGVKEPTPVQSAVFSPIMAGKNVHVVAPTGTGKTWAYALPILRQWQYSSQKKIQTIVIVPTIELVEQVVSAFDQLAAGTDVRTIGASGIGNIKTQAMEIRAGADVLVGTPGRIKDLILNGQLNPKSVKRLVLDEVDQLIRLGFRPDIVQCMEVLPGRRQDLYFSATTTLELEEWISSSDRPFDRIVIQSGGAVAEGISQRAYAALNYYTKFNLLLYLLRDDATMKRVLVFAGNKSMADRVFHMLEEEFPNEVMVVHANKNPNKRISTIASFEEGRCRILVASDLIARGVDIESVSHVINFMVPRQPEDYVHRIGRTGRALQQGDSITFVSPAEMDLWTEIAALVDYSSALLALPKDSLRSDVFLPEEEVSQYSVKVPQRKADPSRGAAFHEKLDKNKKVPIKVTRADRMKAKYGKRYDANHGGGRK